MREFWVWGAPQSIGIEIGVDLLVPIDVDELVKDVSAGTDYTLSILEDGSAIVDGYINDPEDYQGHFACGCESLGLETGVNSKTISSVVDLDDTVIDAPEWEKVFAGVESPPGSGQMHSLLIDVDGNVYASGNNNKGQLCLGDDEPRIFATQIDLPDGEKAVSAVVGGEHTLILTESGKIYGCGSNQLGQLGLGDTLETDRPEEVEGLSSVESISGGRDFATIKTKEGIYVMGDNTFGKLT